MVWLVIGIVRWAAMLSVATVAVRLATAVVGALRPSAVTKRRRRDGLRLLGWLVLLVIGLSLIHCQLGDFYSFVDPQGGEWAFDGHGWPLTEQTGLFDRSAKPSLRAIYLTAIAADLVLSLVLLSATRLVVDYWIVAWDSPHRWSMFRRNAAGWCASLFVVLLGERFFSRPRMFPGTELIVYTTILHEPPAVHAGLLIGLASAVYLAGISALRGIHTVRRWRDEGMI